MHEFEPGPDDRLPLKELARYVPRSGRRAPHVLTLHRWHRHGVRVGDRRVRLQTQRVGGRRFGTLRWLAEFLAAQQDKHAEHSLSPSTSSIDRQLDKELEPGRRQQSSPGDTGSDFNESVHSHKPNVQTQD